MTFTISLPPEEEKKLEERAAASGVEIADYVRQLIRKDISLPSLAELFAPVHRAVRESGISQAELDPVPQAAIHASRAKRGP